MRKMRTRVKQVAPFVLVWIACMKNHISLRYCFVSFFLFFSVCSLLLFPTFMWHSSWSVTIQHIRLISFSFIFLIFISIRHSRQRFYHFIRTLYLLIGEEFFFVSLHFCCLYTSGPRFYPFFPQVRVNKIFKEGFILN